MTDKSVEAAARAYTRAPYPSTQSIARMEKALNAARPIIKREAYAEVAEQVEWRIYRMTQHGLRDGAVLNELLKYCDDLKALKAGKDSDGA